MAAKANVNIGTVSPLAVSGNSHVFNTMAACVLREGFS